MVQLMEVQQLLLKKLQKIRHLSLRVRLRLQRTVGAEQQVKQQQQQVQRRSMLLQKSKRQHKKKKRTLGKQNRKKKLRKN